MRHCFQDQHVWVLLSGLQQARLNRAVRQAFRSGVYLNSPVFSRRSLNSLSSEEAKRQSVKSMGSDSSSSGPSSLLSVDIKNFKAMWNEEVYQNRERWKAQACKGTVYMVRCGSTIANSCSDKTDFSNKLTRRGEIGWQGCNALTVCRACSCCSGFSLTCICGGFHLTCANMFFSCSGYSDNKFGLKLLRCPLYGSMVSKQMKPVSFTDSWFIYE